MSTAILLVADRTAHRREGQALDLAGEVPVVSAEFTAGSGWQEQTFAQSVRGRYICFEAIDSHNPGDVASIAEFYLLDDNGERLPRELWKVEWADSEELKQGNRGADKLFDLQESTYWSTVPGVSYPHSFVIDLGSESSIGGIQYLPRMEQGAPGSVRKYNVYVRTDTPFKY